MLLFDMTRRLLSRGSESETHAHEHVAAYSGHHDGDEDLSDGTSRIVAPTHSHSHDHRGDSDYSNKGAVGIGAIHGIGAETPTQVVVFLAAASAGGVTAGVAVLLAFVVGLVTANSAITFASVFGFASASKRPSVQIGMGIFTAVMSIGIGLLSGVEFSSLRRRIKAW